jgi:dTDP-4-dehydrorhamnose reductase
LKKYRILLLGGTGMLGHTLLRHLSKVDAFEVFATVRTNSIALSQKITANYVFNVSAENTDSIIDALSIIKPEIIINCIGLIKQLPSANEPIPAITINALLPHRLAMIAKTAGARMIHISTDCVFSGKKGNYIEDDPSDANDLYGKTKFLGEVAYPHCITLRTSIIGHEIHTHFGLVEWFLSQKDTVKGFKRAIYSGIPTMELSKIIADYVIPNDSLSGVYHVSSNPISKYELLKIIVNKYGLQTEIQPENTFFCDRSLLSEKFRKKTGYTAPSWNELIDSMHDDYLADSIYSKN